MAETVTCNAAHTPQSKRPQTSRSWGLFTVTMSRMRRDQRLPDRSHPARPGRMNAVQCDVMATAHPSVSLGGTGSQKAPQYSNARVWSRLIVISLGDDRRRSRRLHLGHSLPIELDHAMAKAAIATIPATVMSLRMSSHLSVDGCPCNRWEERPDPGGANVMTVTEWWIDWARTEYEGNCVEKFKMTCPRELLRNRSGQGGVLPTWTRPQLSRPC